MDGGGGKLMNCITVMTRGGGFMYGIIFGNRERLLIHKHKIPNINMSGRGRIFSYWSSVNKYYKIIDERQSVVCIEFYQILVINTLVQRSAT
jgi:hypothetical protein